MIVFRIGQHIAFAVEDKTDARKFRDHDRRIDAMQGYRDFLDRVAESRGMTTEEVDDRDGLSGPAAL
jgi:hypothetical protein